MDTTNASTATVARTIVGAIIRKGLTMLGKAAVSRGPIDKGSVDGATDEAVELTLGALSVDASGAWTWFATTNVHQRLAAALADLRGRPALSGAPASTSA